MPLSPVNTLRIYIGDCLPNWPRFGEASFLPAFWYDAAAHEEAGMTDNIISLVSNDSPQNADEMLEGAKGRFESAIVLGYNQEGEMGLFCTHDLKASGVLWLIEAFKANLLAGLYTDD